ncbi:MAG: hypothetical protein HOV80_19165 [Polyangiaceae bacterium]|nr:hypothetical protein [Polyangiaceae bacterium]
MRRVLMSTLAAAALFGCRRPPAPAIPMGPPKPPGPPRPPLVEAPASAPTVKWSQAFDRACTGSITPPVVSADDASVAFCSRLFETKHGAFEVNIPIGVAAILPDGRLLSNDYEGHWKVGTPNGAKKTSTDGSLSSIFAISPDGKRFATFEDDSIVVRELDPLKEVASIDVGEVSPEPIVGFFADERATAIVPGDCKTKRRRNKDGSEWRETKCASRSWMVVEGDKLVKLRDAADIESVAFAAAGNRAIVRRSGGARAVVALPGGETIVELPNDARDEVGPFALDRDGARVAYLDERGVVVQAIENKTLRELARVDGAMPSELVLAADGKTLYLADNSRMLVLREGEPERQVAVASYAATPPKGFAPFRAQCPNDGEPPNTGDDDLCRARQRAFGESGSLVDEGRSMLLPEGHLRAFLDKENFIEVYVTAVDAAEYPEKDDKAWAKSIVSASVWSGSEKGVEKTIKMRGSRAFDYAEFWRGGCDPKDIYVSAFERDGLLYRVRIEVPPEHPQKELTPLFKAFVDEPFGSGDVSAHAFVKPPRAPDGPC